MIRLDALPLLVAVALIAACGDVTNGGASCLSPMLGEPPAGRTHPSPAVRDSVALSGTPFAVAISPAREVYVTQLHAAAANRADLPATAFSAPFNVGELPSQVRMSPDGGTAYVGNQDARTVTFVRVGLETVLATVAVPGSGALPGGSILTLGVTSTGPICTHSRTSPAFMS
jgi:hypothetical protein